MKKTNSKIIVLITIVMVIVAVICIFIGMGIGKYKKDDTPKETGVETDVQSGTQSSGELSETIDGNGTNEAGETVEPTDEADMVAVIVGDREVPMDIINVHTYTLRDSYVEMYGEDPWGITLDDGRTIEQFAKDTLLDDLVRIQILNDKAGDYGIELTDEEISQCEKDAQGYFSGIGTEIAQQFGINHDAVIQVYKEAELSVDVYNAAVNQLEAEMRGQEAYANMSEEEFEAAVNSAYDEMYEGWLAEYDVTTTEIWDAIVIGAVG